MKGEQSKGLSAIEPRWLARLNDRDREWPLEWPDEEWRTEEDRARRALVSGGQAVLMAGPPRGGGYPAPGPPAGAARGAPSRPPAWRGRSRRPRDRARRARPRCRSPSRS